MSICIREPIPEIEVAAACLKGAADAYALGDRSSAVELIKRADIESIREWTESIWGKKSPLVLVTKIPHDNKGIVIVAARMPTAAQKKQLHNRDGFHCRFCGIPVIRAEIRKLFQLAFPEVAIWGKKNIDQHAAFQAMWAQYDHVLPHSKGGTNELDNLIITCAPCNFGKMDHSVGELGLLDPRNRSPKDSSWNGLEIFRLMAVRQ